MGYQHLQVSRSLLNDLFLCSSLAVNDAGKRCCRALQLFTLGFFPQWMKFSVFSPQWMKFSGQVFPLLEAIAPKLPWEGEGSLLPPNLVEHYASSWLQGGINKIVIHKWFPKLSYTNDFHWAELPWHEAILTCFAESGHVLLAGTLCFSVGYFGIFLS